MNENLRRILDHVQKADTRLGNAHAHAQDADDQQGASLIEEARKSVRELHTHFKNQDDSFLQGDFKETLLRYMEEKVWEDGEAAACGESLEASGRQDTISMDNPVSLETEAGAISRAEAQKAIQEWFKGVEPQRARSPMKIGGFTVTPWGMEKTRTHIQQWLEEKKRGVSQVKGLMGPKDPGRVCRTFDDLRQYNRQMIEEEERVQQTLRSRKAIKEWAEETILSGIASVSPMPDFVKKAEITTEDLASGGLTTPEQSERFNTYRKAVLPLLSKVRIEEHPPSKKLTTFASLRVPEDIHEQIEKGEITGYSMGGYAERTPRPSPLSTSSLLASLGFPGSTYLTYDTYSKKYHIEVSMQDLEQMAKDKKGQ